MTPKRARYALILATAYGLCTGIFAVLGWAHVSAAAMGFFAFCGILIAARYLP